MYIKKRFLKKLGFSPYNDEKPSFFKKLGF